MRRLVVMSLRKVISGGQTGADQAGLCAAHNLGLETGGTAPPKFVTDVGPAPNVLRAYGLVEGEPDPRTYPKRTRKNVQDSDGTVLFGDMSSPGSRLTIRYCIQLNKPYAINPDAEQLARHVRSNNIEVLNVAGNRERTNPGIGAKVIGVMIDAFKERR